MLFLCLSLLLSFENIKCTKNQRDYRAAVAEKDLPLPLSLSIAWSLRGDMHFPIENECARLRLANGRNEWTVGISGPVDAD